MLAENWTHGICVDCLRFRQHRQMDAFIALVAHACSDSFIFYWPSWAHLKSPSWVALEEFFNYTLSPNVMRPAWVQPHRWHWSPLSYHTPVCYNTCWQSLEKTSTQQMLGGDAQCSGENCSWPNTCLSLECFVLCCRW